MTSQRMFQNANKIAYLVQQYPEHKLTEIIGLLQMPAIEINTAIWRATEEGFISEPDKDNGTIELLKAPETWDFGTTVNDIKDMLLYSFAELSKKETDLEENYLSQWTAGYPTHDILIATRHLLETKELAQYMIEDKDSTYTFFTLYENRDKLWGRQQFKIDPLDGPGDSAHQVEEGEVTDEN